MMTIKYAPPSKGLCQAFSYGALVALVSSKNEQIHPFVFCADYFNEVFSSVVTKKPKSIYGFKYNAEQDINPCNKYTKVLISHDSQGIVENKVAALKFLNDFETTIGLKKSTFHLCPNHPIYKKNVILVKGDKRIRNSILLLTAWRIVLRNSFAANESKDFNENFSSIKRNPFIGDDSGHLGRVENFIKYILEKDNDFVNYTNEGDFSQDVHSVHNDSGLSRFDIILTRKSYDKRVPWQTRIYEKLS